MNQSATGNPWNDRYAGHEFFYGTEPNDFLKEQLASLPRSGKVLFLAEGEGRNAVWFAAQAPHAQVTGVDGSSTGLEKAQQLAAERGVRIETRVADLTQFDIGFEQWDAIISIWAHLPQPTRADLHQRCVKGLKSGGLFLLEAYTPKQLTYKTGGPPVVELLMTASALRTELAGLDLDIIQERDREIHEGRGHDGMSAVVQVLGRKSS